MSIEFVLTVTLIGGVAVYAIRKLYEVWYLYFEARVEEKQFEKIVAVVKSALLLNSSLAQAEIKTAEKYLAMAEERRQADRSVEAVLYQFAKMDRRVKNQEVIGLLKGPMGAVFTLLVSGWSLESASRIGMDQFAHSTISTLAEIFGFSDPSTAQGRIIDVTPSK